MAGRQPDPLLALMLGGPSREGQRGHRPIDAARFALAMTRVDGEERPDLRRADPIWVNWDAERAPQMFELIAQDETGDVPQQLCTPSSPARQRGFSEPVVESASAARRWFSTTPRSYARPGSG